jgi:alpha-L-fucosidase
MAQEPATGGVRRRTVLRGASVAAGAATLAGSVGYSVVKAPAASATNLQTLQQAFVDLRFGMFIHFNMGTYHDQEWVDPGKDPKSFNPTNLDCGQWARAAKSAGMRFAALTAKHHDGFCLWPTKQTGYNVMNSSRPVDIMKQYVDAFRAQGVTPCLYYSIWDRQQGIQSGSVSRADIDFIKAQLTELLGGTYGTFPLLIFDGWGWQMGHKQVPYGEIRAHVKSLQPNCMILDHNGQTEPWDEDIIYFEEPLRVWAPTTNTYASVQGQNIVNTGWFWHPETPGTTPRSVDDIVNTHIKALEPRYCNFLLNCMPNPQGLLDTNIVNRLAEVGRAWSPNASRPALPAQPFVLQHAVTPVSATASSNAGTAVNAIDGILAHPTGNPNQTLWQSGSSLPQSVTLDLGAIHTNLDALFYYPRQLGVTTGNITGFRVLVSSNGSTFTQVTSGTWAADHRIKRARFAASTARYIRLEATSASGANYAVVSEITVGGIAAKPVPVNPTDPPAGNHVRLVNRRSGKSLDVFEASTADGAAIVQWSATGAGSANQQWQLVPAGAYVKLVSRNSGKVAEVNARSLAEDAIISQWTDNDGTHQQWSRVDAGGGYITLVNRRSGKVLGVRANATNDGAAVVQQSDTGNTSQHWQIVAV